MTTRYASSAQDPSVLPAVPLNAQNTQGLVHELESHVNLPVGATATDLTIYGRIPSNAKISPDSKFYYGALTGVTSFELGLYVETTPFVPDTTKGSATCLVGATDIHTAGSVDFSAAIAIANRGKYAWETAGLAADPGGWLLVVGTTVTGTSTAAADTGVHVKQRLT